MGARDRPSVVFVEAIEVKLKEAAAHDAPAPVILTLPEIDALRYLCSLYPLSEDIRARALRRARSRSQKTGR